MSYNLSKKKNTKKKTFTAFLQRTDITLWHLSYVLKGKSLTTAGWSIYFFRENDLLRIAQFN